MVGVVLSRSGFTLLEVMVAIAIMAFIMVLLWSSTSQSLRSQERIAKRDEVFHAGGVALRKFSEDLEMAFLARQTPSAGTQPQAAAAGTTAVAAVEGQAFKTFFIGEDSGEADALRFTSLSHLRLFKGAKESDQCRIAYEIVQSEEEGGGLNLVRREDPWLDATTEVKGDPLLLVEKVKSFDLEYYDLRKGDWGKEWDTEKMDWKEMLPIAVRVTLVFADPDNEERTIPMSTAVMIPLSRGPIEF